MSGALESGQTAPQHLFVYGTLRPGEVRWRHLAPFVDGDGHADTAMGRLFDTGLGYPAAMFDGAADDAPVIGHTFHLAATTYEAAIERLDEVEGAVRGLYQRVRIVTAAGLAAWAYQYGVDPTDAGIALTRIVGGDWLLRTG